MHWAVHRHTAAELIVERADAELQAERQISFAICHDFNFATFPYSV